MLVREELYPWGSAALNFRNPKIYLLLSNFETIAFKLGEYDEENTERETRPTVTSAPISKKKREEEEIKGNFSARIKKNFIFYILQTINFLIIMLVWLAAIMSAKDNLAYNNMNRSIISQTTGARQAFDETYSTYITELQKTSTFFRVKQPEDILPFVSSIEYLLYHVQYVINSNPGTISGFTYFFPYMQLRQLRSKVDDCDFPEFDVNNVCARELSEDQLTNDLERNGFLSEYDDGDSRSPGTRGTDNVYPLSGNILNIAATNYTRYIQDTQAIVELDWMTLNTRFTSLTVNLYNPSLNAYTCIVYMFMLDLEQDVVPRYQITSYYYEFYEPGELVLSGLLFFTCITMILFTMRDMFMHQDEVKYMSELKAASKTKTPEEMKKHLADWEDYDRKGFRERCHSLDLLSIVALISVIGVVSLVITHFCWYYIVIKEEFEVSNTEFVDLLVAAQFYDTIIVIQGIITILLSVSILKFSKYWISIMAIMVKMIIIKVEHFLGFCCASIIGLIGFAMYFYGVLGPYEYRAAINYLALSGMVRFFVGRWFTTDNFGEFISVWYCILPMIAFLYYRMTISTLSIINLQWQFMKAREGVNLRENEEASRKDDAKKEKA
mmetsp:Transcript_27261/g.48985  ORF Transcript_27261/g.48985 Transcript_27261/m.48985 type:complete len:611 (-) Transcript_27261:23-1855(-)